MKKPIRLILFVILFLIAVAVAISSFMVSRQKDAIAALEDRISLLKKETVPLRFMVLSRGIDSISARFRFYNADGEEIASFERSWKGRELAIDTVVVPVGASFLAFPSRIFTDALPPSHGTELFSYYADNGFPSIYYSKNLDSQIRRSLTSLFSSLVRWEKGDGEGDNPDRKSFGSAVHEVERVRSFEVGAVYDLVSRTSGGIEVIRE